MHGIRCGSRGQKQEERIFRGNNLSSICILQELSKYASRSETAGRSPCPEVSSPAPNVFKLRLEPRGEVQSRVTNYVICSVSKYVPRTPSQELGELAVNKRQNPVLVGLRVHD